MRRSKASVKHAFPSSHSFCLVFLFALFSCLLATSCKKSRPERLTPAKIHAITRELANAAHSAAPAGTQIRINLQASEKDPEAADRLEITVLSDGLDSSRSETSKIERSLDAAANRNNLTRHTLLCPGGICFYYSRSGAQTQLVHIHVTARLAVRSNGAGQSPGARLAIILDDLGNDLRAADAIFELPYPLTISVLPNHEHSQGIAQEAERRGYQVMLHLPMQSVANEKAEAQELRPGMPAGEVSKLVSQFLQEVPGVLGVNNHQGSEATSDRALMRELMRVLRDHHLFYIDSRTTAATVAYETAQNSRVPSAFRNVPFLDDVTEVGAVRKQLELALRGAREKGEAVAIGHPHSATLQALREVLPSAQSEGVRLTFASELVH